MELKHQKLRNKKKVFHKRLIKKKLKYKIKFKKCSTSEGKT